MKKQIILLIGVCLFSFATVVHADEISGDNYWSVSLDQLTLGGDDSSDDLDMNSVNFAFGHRFNRFISAEANMSWWMLNHHMPGDELPNGNDINMDSAQGLSLRFDAPRYKRLGAYAQLSYNIVHFDVKGGKNLNDNGIGYSAGLEYQVWNGSVFARYAQILENDNDDPNDPSVEDLTALGLGYKLDLPF